MSTERLQGQEIKAEAKPQEFRPFTDQETRALIEDHAHFIDLDGETIEYEDKSGRLFSYIGYDEDGLLTLPSINTRVAIFPDRKRFFIPNSRNKSLSTQEKLAEKDCQELRKRLGLQDDSLTVIIPDQASTLTELTFKYLDETTKKGKGVWLLGPDYDYEFGIAKNPGNKLFPVVHVGNPNPVNGLIVRRWHRGGDHNVAVVRLVVAKKK